MLKRALGFVDNDKEDSTWKAARFLGEGSFGKVVLWEKEGKDGQILDRLALKETKDGGSGARRVDEDDASTSEEAAFMLQLAKAKSPNIVELRKFKHVAEQEIWRFYLEYCPHGDLEQLSNLYRKRPASSRRDLPEEFHWHVFHGLANAANILNTHPFTNLHTGQPTTFKMLHLDLKPANVLLGYPSEKAEFSTYPIPKMADFGLAVLTSDDDEDNPHAFVGAGTPTFRGPEREGFVEDGFMWYDSGGKLGQSNNIWACGAIMFELLMLAGIENYWAHIQRKELWDDLDVSQLMTELNTRYSAELLDLVRGCLEEHPLRRPVPEVLLALTKNGLERWESQLKGRKDKDGKVCMAGGEEAVSTQRSHKGTPSGRPTFQESWERIPDPGAKPPPGFEAPQAPQPWNSRNDNQDSSMMNRWLARGQFLPTVRLGSRMTNNGEEFFSGTKAASKAEQSDPDEDLPRFSQLSEEPSTSGWVTAPEEFKILNSGNRPITQPRHGHLQQSRPPARPHVLSLAPEFSSLAENFLKVSEMPRRSRLKFGKLYDESGDADMKDQ